MVEKAEHNSKQHLSDAENDAALHLHWVYIVQLVHRQIPNWVEAKHIRALEVFVGLWDNYAIKENKLVRDETNPTGPSSLAFPSDFWPMPHQLQSCLKNK
jgi:hypothetical protein